MFFLYSVSQAAGGEGDRGRGVPPRRSAESSVFCPRALCSGHDMAAGGVPAAGHPGAGSCYLNSFRLYETQSNFYMIGRDKSRTIWRVLKIDRSETSELNISEDPTTYSESEYHDLLTRIHDGNRSTGGLKFVTNCYGIIGFVKFLGPYYMLLITKRRKIGSICGHIVYAISKNEMIAIPNSTVRSNMAYSKDENRYKKLISAVDLTKDFFFSYSYHVMHSLQKNFCDGETGQVLYETMFVWNEFLTRGIRNHLKNTMWMVALVYGFFKQAKLSISGKDFKLTLIARRSRHYAGTRYLKRGVNEKGRVANDVETEQVVFEDTSREIPTQMSSVVQNRGSIPLFWSQETSWLNVKPDIIFYNKDQNYEATRLHFDNLVKRYGNPIIILNLIKTCEKKPRESILRAEFAKAIAYLNKDLSEENRLRFLHWDLHRHSRRKDTNVLELLVKVAAYALDSTDFFYCQVKPATGLHTSLKCPTLMSCNNRYGTYDVISGYGSQEDNVGNSGISGSAESGNCLPKPPTFQKGVLRTNCIDCLDRTNVAQYAYGLVALGHQLHALGFIDVPKIDLDDPLADDLMHLYERMGDTLALQYGGSAAHNKIFSERRGQWKAATQSQEFFRTIQRYCSNTYRDPEKQDAINVFLGHFQPQQGKPALWELDSDQHYNVGSRGHIFAHENARSFFKRSLSDGNILFESNTPVSNRNAGQKKIPVSLARTQHSGAAKDLSDSLPEMSNESDILNSRHNPVMFCQQLFADSDYSCSSEHGSDPSNCSNFLDPEWLSSSGNSLEEIYDRSSLINSPHENLSTENVIDGITAESTPTISEKGGEETNVELSYDVAQSSDILHEFPDTFVHWVAHGSTICH